MWRQGDVLIEEAAEVPETASRLKQLVLAAGDSTGHRHMIKDRKSAELYLASNQDLFLNVVADEAIIAHPEHGHITLPKGVYRVWKQREFSDQAPRPVHD